MTIWYPGSHDESNFWGANRSPFQINSNCFNQIFNSHIDLFVCFYGNSSVHSISRVAQSARAVEYTDCISADGGKTLPNECPGYDTKQSDGEVPVMLELWGMRSTPSLPLLQSPLTQKNYFDI